MAMIICPECKQEISDQVEVCPKCGLPTQTERKEQGDTENKFSEEELREREYRKLKLRLEDVQKRKKGKLSLFMGLIASVFSSWLFLMFMYDNFNYQGGVSGLVYSVGLGILLGISVGLYWHMLCELQESKIRQRMLDYEADYIQNEVQEDVFENSIKMSYKYLDQYYLQTREQAQKGFFITVCVAIFGAMLIGIGVIAMFLEKTSPSYVTSAAGVITEFIAAIFFYLYNKTVVSMSKYHNKLVLSQNISIALKVAETLPSDDKTKVKNVIISELLKDINSFLIRSDSETKTRKSANEAIRK